ACAVLNILCAALASKLFAGSENDAPSGRSDASGILMLLAATGLLGIGYEVLVVRVLSQVTENTVYTFATLLAVYLVGTAAGAAGYQRWLLTRPTSGAQDRMQDRMGDGLLGALATTCLIGAATLWAAEQVKTLA